ncbi:NAD(P)-binding protein [Dendrothele bispora CBS 962.96]|uniref:NAD(P)-binding protein n=1 Tax=Dendrothele bispora (strain CBS 962.96) TaxID=1314807 RepID=A0A4S8L718_DENBC|nr:NAD(P)-binding protein [Dendrothele bispora CBS 962.96]
MSPSTTYHSTSSSSFSSYGVAHNRFSPLSLFNVNGLVVVVTGGGSGIGRMMATALENNGATVYIIGRRLDALQKTAKENNRFDRIIPLEGDVTDRESLLSLVDKVKSRHGYIDLLVNNAGIARNLYPHPLPSPSNPHPSHHPPSPPDSPSLGSPPVASIKSFQTALWDSGTPEEFAETFATNVTAPYYTTVAFLELLHRGNTRQQTNQFDSAFLNNGSSVPRPPFHASQVITVSSSGSFRIDSKILSMSYTLSKSASTHLGKTLANLLAPWGIRSNVLAPGRLWDLIYSEMTMSQKLDPTTMSSTVPLQRAGTEEEMAGTILFLASPAGAYVNGAVWLIDGGRVVSTSSTY